MCHNQNRPVYCFVCLVISVLLLGSADHVQSSPVKKLTFYVEASGRTRMAVREIAKSIHNKIASETGQVDCVFKYVRNVAGEGEVRAYEGLSLSKGVSADEVQPEDIVHILKWISKSGGGLEGVHTYMALLRNLAREEGAVYVYYSFLCPYVKLWKLKDELGRVQGEALYYAGIITRRGSVEFEPLAFERRTTEYDVFDDLMVVNNSSVVEPIAPEKEPENAPKSGGGEKVSPQTESGGGVEDEGQDEYTKDPVEPPLPDDQIEPDLDGKGGRSPKQDESAVTEGLRSTNSTGSLESESPSSEQSLDGEGGQSPKPDDSPVTGENLDSDLTEGAVESLPANNCQELVIKHVETGSIYYGHEKGMFVYNATYCESSVNFAVSEVMGNGTGYGSHWGLLIMSGEEPREYRAGEELTWNSAKNEFPINIQIKEYLESQSIKPKTEVDLKIEF